MRVAHVVCAVTICAAAFATARGSAQALKPAAAVCINSNTYCALALSGVRQEI